VIAFPDMEIKDCENCQEKYPAVQGMKKPTSKYHITMYSKEIRVCCHLITNIAKQSAVKFFMSISD